MSDMFFLEALIAGAGVALIARPFGCFLIWRRMAYFGDTLAHAALLGVGVALLLGVNLSLAVFVSSALIALMLYMLERQAKLSTDALLGLLSHGTLALGLILLSFVPRGQLNIEGILFGDILAVSRMDIWVIWGGGAVLLAMLVLIWRPLFAATVSPELAAAEGRSRSLDLLLTLLTAAFIALALKIIGALLITALLIIPAAAARRLSGSSPEGMAALASGVGVLAITGGLLGSLEFDTPSGPSIVVAALILFVLTLLRPGRRG